MIVARVVRGISEHFALRYQEWVYSSMLLILSFQLLRPGSTFATSKAYAVMASLAGEETWGMVLLLVGGFRFLALAVNGTFVKVRRLTPYVRSFGAAISAIVWLVLSITFYKANPFGLGAEFCLGLTISDMLISIKTAREAGSAEKEYARACVRSA